MLVITAFLIHAMGFAGDLHEKVRSHPVEEDWACTLDSEMAKKEIVSELQVANARLFIGLQSLLDEYAAIRANWEGEEYVLDEKVKTVKELLEMYYSFHHSLDSCGNRYETKNSSLQAVNFCAVLAPAVGIMAFPVFSKGNAARPLVFNNRLSMRLTGYSLVATGAAGALLTTFGGHSSESLLKNSATEFSLRDQQKLQINIFDALDENTAYLAELLEWDAAQKAAFRKQLRSEVLARIVKRLDVNGADIYWYPSVVAHALGTIDLIPLLEKDKLASVSQLKAIREMQKMHDLVTAAAGVQEDENKLAKLLMQNGGDAMAIRNIRDLVQMNRILSTDFKPPLYRAGQNGKTDTLWKIRKDLTTSLGLIRALCKGAELEKQK